MRAPNERFDPKPPTLDQLQIFLSVVEAGGFSAAARKLGRATSAISYGIANLEDQLGLELFDRRATKTPQLTDAGRAVLADACAISHGVGDLLARARGLASGLEAEVALVVDVMLPTAKLVEVLDAFQSAYTTVALRLHTEALGAVTQMVLNKTADVGIAGPVTSNSQMLTVRQIGTVKLVPVAAPSHPLGQHRNTAQIAAVRNHIQLVLTDRSELTKGQEFGVMSVRTWRLADLGAKHALLLAGVGWGSMPEAMVRDDLVAGRLVRLNIDTWETVSYPFQAIHRADMALGPAASWLIDRFKQAFAAA
jgi:DNA-binding transcriptional LysR family regulator